MPVSRMDVVKARYISYVLYILIGIVMSIISMLVFYLIAGSVDLERAGFGFTFGLGFSLSIPTFMTPLVMIFGIDKNDSFMLVSMIMGFVLFFGSSVIITLFLKNFLNDNFIFRFSYLIFSALLFIVSYLLSCQL